VSELRTLTAPKFDQYVALLCESFGYPDKTHVSAILSQDPCFELDNVLCIFKGKKLISAVTTTVLQFGDYPAIGLSSVITAPAHRGKGYATKLVREAVTIAQNGGIDRALVFAKTTKLYEKIGFKLLDSCITGQIDCPEPLAERPLEERFARMLYDNWATGHPDRLRRSDEQWAKHRWLPAVCLYQAAGYARLTRTGKVHEVVNVGAHQYSLPMGSQWVGLASMADALSIPLLDRTHTEYLLGIGFERAPQFFRNEF
jgi:predicted N-acetyltransferase YhbS